MQYGPRPPPGDPRPAWEANDDDDDQDSDSDGGFPALLRVPKESEPELKRVSSLARRKAYDDLLWISTSGEDLIRLFYFIQRNFKKNVKRKGRAGEFRRNKLPSLRHPNCWLYF